MRPTFDRRLWILLFIILIKCITSTNPQNIKTQSKPADRAPTWSIPQRNALAKEQSFRHVTGDSKLTAHALTQPQSHKHKQTNVNTQKCAKNCLATKPATAKSSPAAQQHTSLHPTLSEATVPFSLAKAAQQRHTQAQTHASHAHKPSQLPSTADHSAQPHKKHSPAKTKAAAPEEHQRVHVAHRSLHREAKVHREPHQNRHHNGAKVRARRDVTAAAAATRVAREDLNNESFSNDEELATSLGTDKAAQARGTSLSTSSEDFSYALPSQQPRDEPVSSLYFNESAGNLSLSAVDDFDAVSQLAFAPLTAKAKRTPIMQQPHVEQRKPPEPIIIIDDVEEFDSGTDRELRAIGVIVDKSEDYSHDEPLEPRVLPLRPVPPNPYEDEEMSVVYAEQHSEIRLMCEVDLDISSSMWYKNGQVVHAMDRTTRVTDYRFIKEANGALTITNVMLEDDGKWQCEAENTRRYTENARPVKLVVLDRPKPPYLLIDSRRLDAGNIFVPVKENSELNLACVSEGGNPKPTLTWEVLLSPGVDRHAQKVSAEVLELEEIKNDKDKNAYKINGGAKSEARLPAVYRAHHNARILCVMEHPTLKIRQNASLLLDVQYTPSFAISRTPGFGYPLREGIEVSLKCDVDSNPPSTPRWQKDDGDTPVPQTGDGFLNFSSIRREHSGWYKCTSRHLNFQYSSIGYYLSVRYDSVDVTSEPDDQDISVAAASHNPNKGQLEVQLGGAVTLQCPQGSLGCWSHLDPVTARLRGLGHGLSTPTGQFSLKDVVYQDAGTYKCIGQSAANKKKLEVLQTVGVLVKGAPTVVARNATPVAYPGSPLHLTVEFCANPAAHAARWLHGDRVFTPGNQYGSTVLAYGVTDLPTPYCKEARLTYVSMHERVPRTFYFIVSSPGGVAEAIFKVNFTMRYRTISNAVDEEEEELSEPEEIHFPVFGSKAATTTTMTGTAVESRLPLLLLGCVCALLWRRYCCCKCGQL